MLTTEQYAFRRGDVIVAVNNGEREASFSLPCGDGALRGALHGGRFTPENGRLEFRLGPCDGEILIPENRCSGEYRPIRTVSDPGRKTDPPAAPAAQAGERPATEPALREKPEPGRSYEEMSIEELQAEILRKLARNGPVTDRMRRDVAENVYRDSLLNWVRSFR